MSGNFGSSVRYKRSLLKSDTVFRACKDRRTRLVKTHNLQNTLGRFQPVNDKAESELRSALSNGFHYNKI